jgi:hypothetical protein
MSGLQSENMRPEYLIANTDRQGLFEAPSMPFLPKLEMITD